MQSRRHPAAIDTRIVYWSYAALVAAGGLLLFGWGPKWFDLDISGQPWAGAALVRVLGSILLAAACFSIALAKVEDSESRRQGLFWLAVGHAAVVGVVLLQRLLVWGPGLADRAAELLFVPIITFFYLWKTADGSTQGRPRTMIRLFGAENPPSTEHLRSAYEERIREAAAQEERNRLARDLHDSVKQQIFVIQTAAATAEARLDSDEAGAKQALSQVRSSARQSMTAMQVMLDQLQAAPLENVGLVEALKEQCEALGFRSGAQVEFEPAALPPSESFAPGAQEAILRVAQEALANVARHARAARVTVSLRPLGRRVVLQIRDNGAGFDTNQDLHGMGIANMRARARQFGGTFELNSQAGNGTSITLSIPYEIREPREHKRLALGWIGFLFAIVFLYARGDGPGYAVLGLLCAGAIALGRETVAYFRTRKRADVAP